MEEVKKRHFGGNFAAIIARKNTKEAQHEKKHLKAYLKGHTFFGRVNHATKVAEFRTQVIYK